MPIKVKGKEPKPTTTTTTTPAPATTTPAPKPSTKLGIPTGVIPTSLKIAYGRGSPWSQVTQDAPLHEKWGARYGVDPAMLMSMEVIESGGNMIWNTGGSGAYGIMQIKESNWGWLAKQLGVSLQTREGQIATAAAILGKEGKGANPRERFLYSYYPVLDSKGNLCLDCKGEDGATPRQYLADMDALIAIINAAADGTTPASWSPPAPKPVDPYRVIFGGDYPRVTYGWLADAGLAYYAYGVGHGTSRATQHTGDDVTVAFGTPIYAPAPGVVDCVGGSGTPRWGQGCGAYADTGNAGPGGAVLGVGNITIMLDSGHKLTLGHSRTATVKPGQRVAAGQHVGTSGGMNGAHIHVEVSVLRNGTYWLLDPKPALVQAMGGEAPVVYAERVPFQVLDDNPEVKVTVVAESLPVLQYANPDAAPVRKPLTKGEVFYAGTKAYGTDNKWWWVTSTFARIPVDGTEAA